MHEAGYNCYVFLATHLYLNKDQISDNFTEYENFRSRNVRMIILFNKNNSIFFLFSGTIWDINNWDLSI